MVGSAASMPKKFERTTLLRVHLHFLSERFLFICPQNDEKRDIAPNAFKCPQMHVESISMRKKRKKTSFWIFRFSAQLPIYFKLKPVCAVFGTNFGAL